MIRATVSASRRHNALMVCGPGFVGHSRPSGRWSPCGESVSSSTGSGASEIPLMGTAGLRYLGLERDAKFLEGWAPSLPPSFWEEGTQPWYELLVLPGIVNVLGDALSPHRGCPFKP